MATPPKIMVLAGTRPEVIKMAPVYDALKILVWDNALFCAARQHDDLLDQALDVFKIKDHLTVAVNRHETGLPRLTSELMMGLSGQFAAIKPDMVMVHGDTTTAMVGALAAFYNKIPVAHVEAGLRTSRFESPFPEEMNRRLIARLATLHYAPTLQAARNLYEEGIPTSAVRVVGNTVVDALQYILRKVSDGKNGAHDIYRTVAKSNKKLVVVTCHRRENHGEFLTKLVKAVYHLYKSVPNLFIVWPPHPNPVVKDAIWWQMSRLMTDPPREDIYIDDSMRYDHFLPLLSKADLVITDSGGVMEEAAVMGRPCLVMRDETERPEALDLPNVELVGQDLAHMIVQATKWLATPPKSSPASVFGDGTAGMQIAGDVVNYLTKETV